jgi:hypothetical protein
MSEERPGGVEPPSLADPPDPVPPVPPVAPVAWQAPVATPLPPGRTSAVSGAAIILLVLGVIGLLAGLAVAASGAVIGRGGNQSFEGLPGFPAGSAPAIGGFVVIVGVLIVVYSLAYIASGIGVLRMRDWGRILGVVLSIISGIVWLRASTGAAATAGAFVVPGALLVARLYVIFALAARWRPA